MAFRDLGTVGQTDLDLLTGDERVVQEAKNRFRKCEEWESNFRRSFIEDVKFAVGDSTNGFQWPNSIRRNRDVDERPVLTVNKTHQHCLQIINDARQNKPSIKISPTGGGATYDSAKIYTDVVRRIEYISNSQAAYDKATQFQVFGGLGYWRIITDYAGDDTFDQEIYIRQVKDPLNVFLDPEINEIDGSDAMYGFIFDDMPQDEFAKRYPKFKHIASRAALGNTDNWMGPDHVRIAEYYRVTEKKVELIAYVDPETGIQSVTKKDDLPEPLLNMLLADPTTRKREVIDKNVEWYLIAGDEVIDRNDWPGKYVPIVRVIGEEIVIDGELDRKGHCRALKDPQRIYNYWTSSAVEFVALQQKVPWIAPVAAIEGFETYYQSSNRVNHAVMPYKHVDDAGNPIPAPVRQAPPVMAQAYIEGMQIAANEMMMVSGQYQAVMGQQSNETSGKAINERQRQGENATYHYIDNLAHAVRFTGKILIDLIPKIYDTQRILKIIAEDGSESDVTVDPKAKVAMQLKEQKLTGEVVRIFNPSVGKYEVQSDIGPNYGTRRQEAFNAFSQVIAQNPALTMTIGDLMFKNADFPGADEIAERLKRLVPAQALGTGAPPEVAALQAQIQSLSKTTEALMSELTISKMKLQQKDKAGSVDEYKAITDRLKALLPTILNPKDIAQSIVDTINMDKQNTHDLLKMDKAHQQNLQAQTLQQQHQAGMQQGQQQHQEGMQGDAQEHQANLQQMAFDNQPDTSSGE